MQRQFPRSRVHYFVYIIACLFVCLFGVVSCAPDEQNWLEHHLGIVFVIDPMYTHVDKTLNIKLYFKK